ncbi:VWA domain-containing protein [Actinocatenispora comari]|jgi:Ca-activated chloride channel family protein|uniref:Membrane protein n=1 Tax=Actinocatenispora comari TaxID=2807577 RepID=A0A8J4A905_9ACTN|nr:VWA domain-containing protein [Actinocatenispora comari]GIL26458.1 membrane protein [Actinocatenispora comari]
MIRFLSPWWLLAIVPVLALAGVYVWVQLHRRSFAMRFSNLELLQRLTPRGIGWRRHASAGALVLSLLALALGMARPAVDVQQPMERATVILAIDVSLSMEATDVAPNRLRAAQSAAKDFVKQLPRNFNVGVVSFAKAANVVASPTKDRDQVYSAINGLRLAESTATGEAVFTSLQAIATVPADGASGAPPARIVLLSDGFRTYGRTIEDAGKASSAANVPVSTIAFGTDHGHVSIGGQTTPVPVDKQSLHKLADMTKGHYYAAASATELRQVYQDMGSSIGHRTMAKEIAQWYIGFGLLFGLAAAAMSLLWSSRMP